VTVFFLLSAQTKSPPEKGDFLFNSCPLGQATTSLLAGESLEIVE